MFSLLGMLALPLGMILLLGVWLGALSRAGPRLERVNGQS